jgi:hypothetical protein
MSGLQSKWSTSDHIGQGLERAAGFEFDSCADGVANGQAKEGASGALEEGDLRYFHGNQYLGIPYT